MISSTFSALLAMVSLQVMMMPQAVNGICCCRDVDTDTYNCGDGAYPCDYTPCLDDCVATNSPTDTTGADGSFYCINGGAIGGKANTCTCTSCNAGFSGDNCQTADVTYSWNTTNAVCPTACGQAASAPPDTHECTASDSSAATASNCTDAVPTTTQGCVKTAECGGDAIKPYVFLAVPNAEGATTVTDTAPNAEGATTVTDTVTNADGATSTTVTDTVTNADGATTAVETETNAEGATTSTTVTLTDAVGKATTITVSDFSTENVKAIGTTLSTVSVENAKTLVNTLVGTQLATVMSPTQRNFAMMVVTAFTSLQLGGRAQEAIAFVEDMIKSLQPESGSATQQDEFVTKLRILLATLKMKDSEGGGIKDGAELVAGTGPNAPNAPNVPNARDAILDGAQEAGRKPEAKMNDDHHKQAGQATAVEHDHNGDGVADHAGKTSAEAKATAVEHDHNGDGVADHAGKATAEAKATAVEHDHTEKGKAAAPKNAKKAKKSKSTKGNDLRPKKGKGSALSAAAEASQHQTLTFWASSLMMAAAFTVGLVAAVVVKRQPPTDTKVQGLLSYSVPDAAVKPSIL